MLISKFLKYIDFAIEIIKIYFIPENASHAVRKATDNLVKAAQDALDNHADDPDKVDLNATAVGNVVEVILIKDYKKYYLFVIIANKCGKYDGGY